MQPDPATVALTNEIFLAITMVMCRCLLYWHTLNFVLDMPRVIDTFAPKQVAIRSALTPTLVFASAYCLTWTIPNVIAGHRALFGM